MPLFFISQVRRISGRVLLPPRCRIRTDEGKRKEVVLWQFWFPRPGRLTGPAGHNSENTPAALERKIHHGKEVIPWTGLNSWPQPPRH